MSHESESSSSVLDMRLSAYAAPTARMEREELSAAQRQADKEWIEKLGSSAELVLDLEARLALAIDDRKRAQIEANYAKGQLEQAHQTMSAITGHDTRALNRVELGMALSSGLSKLATLAAYVNKAKTLEDLVTIKRVASNLGVIQPQTMAEAAKMMGLSERRAG